MKKVLLSMVAAVAMSMSFSANAALEPIDGADVYFGQANLSNVDAVSDRDIQVNLNQKTLDHAVKNINDVQLLKVNSPALNQANAQTLMNALPKVDGSGRLHINLQGSSITYGTINMGMGDLTKIPQFKEQPVINR